MIDKKRGDSMEEMKLGYVEAHFADLVWENEPMTTRELVILCEKELKWKRTTTYTVLKKLCDKGIFKSENKMVTSIMSREEFYSIQSEQFVKETFKGSLPAFIAAFTQRRELSEKELQEIKELLEKKNK